jgi:hypothetical protein
MDRLKRLFREMASSFYVTGELRCRFDFGELEEKLCNLNDREMSRLALYLDHTEIEIIAILKALDRSDYDLLSDMTHMFDRQRHAGATEDGDGMVNPDGVHLHLCIDHESTKGYMNSIGVRYTKLDALTASDRAQALRYLDLIHEANASGLPLLKTVYREVTVAGKKWSRMVVTFATPEFGDMAMSDSRVIELAKAHNTTEVDRLRDMLSHERSLTAGVL